MKYTPDDSIETILVLLDLTISYLFYLMFDLIYWDITKIWLFPFHFRMFDSNTMNIFKIPSY